MTGEHPLISLLRVVMVTHPNTLVNLYGGPMRHDDEWILAGRIVNVSECGRVVQVLEDDGDLTLLRSENINRITYRVPGTANFDEGEDVAADAIKQGYVKLATKDGLVHDAKLYKPQRTVTKRRR